MSENAEALRVEAFGRDCLGNITGYRVVSGYGLDRVYAGQFCGDIYVTGSFEQAKIAADELCNSLNSKDTEAHVV